jgi:hypothetical protein
MSDKLKNKTEAGLPPSKEEGDYGEPVDPCRHCGAHQSNCWVYLDGQYWRTMECYQRELKKEATLKEARDKLITTLIIGCSLSPVAVSKLEKHLLGEGEVASVEADATGARTFSFFMLNSELKKDVPDDVREAWDKIGAYLIKKWAPKESE